MATVKEINHDSSTTIGDFYSTVTDTDGAITVAPGAALAGSTNGIEMDYDAGSNVPILEEPFAAIAGNEIRFRARINIDNIATFTANQSLMNLRIRNSASGAPFRVILNANAAGDGAVIFVFVATDIGITSLGVETDVPSGDVCFEIRAIRETADGEADGIADFFLANSLIESVSNLENFDIWLADGGMQEVRPSFAGGTSHTGVLYYDEFILDDDSETGLGCFAFSGYDLVLGGGQP